MNQFSNVCNSAVIGQLTCFAVIGQLTCFALEAVSSTCFSALAEGVEAVDFAGIFFLGDDLAAGEDLAGGEVLAEDAFFLPESSDGFATATTSLLPSLHTIKLWFYQAGYGSLSCTNRCTRVTQMLLKCVQPQENYKAGGRH